MPTLRSPIKELRGIGPSTARKISRLGIKTILDLISHFPLRHEDLRKTTPIAKLPTDATVVIRGRIQLIAARRGVRRRRMSITEGLIEDGTGTARLVWFNQPYLATSFKAGDEVYIVGKLSVTPYGHQIQAPLIERVGDKKLIAGRLLPVYRATAGLTQRHLRSLITSALPYITTAPDWLPVDLRNRERLVPLAQALRDIHFPSSLQKLAQARERLKFGELLPFMLSTMRMNQRWNAFSAHKIPLDNKAIRDFVGSLPFTLTDDQRRAAWEIVNDLAHPRPMHRLLEGDVGSGKTAVAAIAMFATALAGRQAALLAPTDILARQHHATLTRLFGVRFPIALLTRTQRELTGEEKPSKRTLLSALNSGKIPIIIGTHALLNEKISLPSISLVIVDEQHRFGVEQRHTFQQKGGVMLPHLLSMTATPIPRTLALTLFGTLKLSLLTKMPPGRTPVVTTVVTSAEESIIMVDIHARVNRGEQVYIVCPLIEESDELGVAAATTEFERLRTGPLEALTLGLLHGALPAHEKQHTLEQFRLGNIDVLVSTPVIEVGVDVPNATLIVIEGAERFGLAQLHQLRGRVGRSNKPSHCYIVSESERPNVRERLAMLEATNDGFRLAEEDLQRRGPGDLYGIRQSGLPNFRMVSLSDIELMKRTKTIAEQFLKDDPELETAPLLKKKVASVMNTIHQE